MCKVQLPGKESALPQLILKGPVPVFFSYLIYRPYLCYRYYRFIILNVFNYPAYPAACDPAYHVPFEEGLSAF